MYLVKLSAFSPNSSTQITMVEVQTSVPRTTPTVVGTLDFICPPTSRRRWMQGRPGMGYGMISQLIHMIKSCTTFSGHLYVVLILAIYTGLSLCNCFSFRYTLTRQYVFLLSEEKYWDLVQWCIYCHDISSSTEVLVRPPDMGEGDIRMCQLLVAQRTYQWVQVNPCAFIASDNTGRYTSFVFAPCTETGATSNLGPAKVFSFHFFNSFRKSTVPNKYSWTMSGSLFAVALTTIESWLKS